MQASTNVRRTPPGRRSGRGSRVLLAVLAMLLLSLFVLLAGGTPLQAAPPSGAKVDISATKGWQRTGVYVGPGETLFWSWESGKWTYASNQPKVGPEGHVDRPISQGKQCKLDPNKPSGELIGRVGDSGKQVNLDRGSGGGGFTNYGSKGGYLYLRINEVDRC
jgi:hypothetical protein